MCYKCANLRDAFDHCSYTLLVRSCLCGPWLTNGHDRVSSFSCSFPCSFSWQPARCLPAFHLLCGRIGKKSARGYRFRCRTPPALAAQTRQGIGLARGSRNAELRRALEHLDRKSLVLFLRSALSFARSRQSSEARAKESRMSMVLALRLL